MSARDTRGCVPAPRELVFRRQSVLCRGRPAACRMPLQIFSVGSGIHPPPPLRKSARTLRLPRTTGLRFALHGRQRLSHAQPPWEMSYFKHLPHSLWILLRNLLLFCKNLTYLINVDLSKTFSKRCLTVQDDVHVLRVFKILNERRLCQHCCQCSR